MSYEYILFDLDGTLINSIDGILYSLKYTLQQMNKNFPFQNKNKILQFIGPPLKD
jgi:phosphoglycolate phosphatase